ncbi:hypothetical protein AVEN_95376-1 [Araneus ventricosus]|uniref:Uncharacterized protein n=1 Tax=Araneus ventricosus TaxID=182803 RepID=A0A4Y2CGK3_ARAVE|nr:hypothetical protein AVEN_95376-1 [Araneus ventricosus]
MNPSCVELLFAHDLMRFVMRQHRLTWMPADIVYFYRHTCVTKFTYAIGMAVIEMTDILKLQIKEKFKHMCESGFTSNRHFEMEMKSSALTEFTNGFNLRRFLAFCGMVTGLAVRFYLHGCSQAPYQAVAVIAEVMMDNKGSFKSSGGWDSLQEECIDILTSDYSSCGCFSRFQLPLFKT